MSPNSNPFLRGYQNLRIERTLCITYEDDCPPAWRPLHPSQAHLPDDQAALFPCVFNNDFALITEGQDIPEDLDTQCRTEGVVRTVVYAVSGDDSGQSVHVGDTYSEEAAQEVVRRLSFETGFYSRCWEISSAHLTVEAGRFLAELADIATPRCFLFVAFRIPYSPAIGVKLIATSWTERTCSLSRALPLKSCGRSTGPKACRSPSWKCCTWLRSPTSACWCSMPMRRCWTDCPCTTTSNTFEPPCGALPFHGRR